MTAAPNFNGRAADCAQTLTKDRDNRAISMLQWGRAADCAEIGDRLTRDPMQGLLHRGRAADCAAIH